MITTRELAIATYYTIALLFVLLHNNIMNLNLSLSLSLSFSLSLYLSSIVLFISQALSHPTSKVWEAGLVLYMQVDLTVIV